MDSSFRFASRYSYQLDTTTLPDPRAVSLSDGRTLILCRMNRTFSHFVFAPLEKYEATHGYLNQMMTFSDVLVEEGHHLYPCSKMLPDLYRNESSWGSTSSMIATLLCSYLPLSAAFRSPNIKDFVSHIMEPLDIRYLVTARNTTVNRIVNHPSTSLHPKFAPQPFLVQGPFFL
jgi:hypothetical protein